jgi:hypothetical protein
VRYGDGLRFVQDESERCVCVHDDGGGLNLGRRKIL